MGKDFDVDARGFVKVYTDGCVLDVGTPAAKAGIGVWFWDGSPYNVSERVLGETDSNVVEIKAVIRAAQVARNAPITKLRIYTDSKIVTDKHYDGKYNTELQKMKSALEPFKVELQHVSGHGGTRGNVKADALANDGAKRHT